MPSRLFRLVLLGALLHAAPAGLAQVRAFVGAQLIPVAGAPVPDGVLLIEDERILAVGARGASTFPATPRSSNWNLPW